MKRKFLKYFLVLALTLALPFRVYAAGSKEAAVKGDLSGTWIKNGSDPNQCICGECIKFDFSKRFHSFCVESNQIYVQSYLKLDAAGTTQAKLMFSEPADLGSGGAALPWDDIDRGSPLAIVDVSQVKKGKIALAWKGLRNKLSGKVYPFGSDYTGSYRKILPRQ